MYKQWLVLAYLEIPAEFPMVSTCLQLSVTNHATAHETETPPNLILEKQMDLHNNNVGHNIGRNASNFVSDQELSDSVYLSLVWGSLRYLSPLGAIIPPNNGISSSTQLTPTNQ